MRDASDQPMSCSGRNEIKISLVCDEIKSLLLSKNSKYGDSALNPCRVFSKASAIEQLLVRIDDKISRIQRGAGLLAKDEDVINDLIGYLVLLKIAMNQSKPEPRPVYYDYTIPYSNGYAYEDPWSGIDIEPSYRRNSR
jgi:hypothetical protein